MITNMYLKWFDNYWISHFTSSWRIIFMMKWITWNQVQDTQRKWRDHEKSLELNGLIIATILVKPVWFNICMVYHLRSSRFHLINHYFSWIKGFTIINQAFYEICYFSRYGLKWKSFTIFDFNKYCFEFQISIYL